MPHCNVYAAILLEINDFQHFKDFQTFHSLVDCGHYDASNVVLTLKTQRSVAGFIVLISGTSFDQSN